MALSVLTLTALLGIGLPVVLPLLSERTTEVGAQVVQDARAQRIEVGRRKLAEANTQLIARNLPTVADPGDSATGDELIIAAATARVLSILPESTVGRLRDDVRTGRAPAVLPSSAQVPDSPLGDGVVQVIPDPSGSPSESSGSANSREPRSPGASPAPAPRRSAARSADPAPAPIPVPAPKDRGLCLLGVVLCSS